MHQKTATHKGATGTVVRCCDNWALILFIGYIFTIGKDWMMGPLARGECNHRSSNKIWDAQF